MTSKSPPPASALLRLRWTALRICRSLLAGILSGYLRRTLLRSALSSGRSSEPPSSGGSLNGLGLLRLGFLRLLSPSEKASEKSMRGSWWVRIAVVNAVLALVAVAMAALLGYWVSDRTAPVENLRVEIIHPVHVGRQMRLKNTFSRKRVCHLRLQQSLVDSTGLRMTAPVEEFVVAPGVVGEDQFMLVFRVPEEAAPGPATYRAVRAYYCNPLHNFLDWPIIVPMAVVNFPLLPAQ